MHVALTCHVMGWGGLKGPSQRYSSSSDFGLSVNSGLMTSVSCGVILVLKRAADCLKPLLERTPHRLGVLWSFLVTTKTFYLQCLTEPHLDHPPVLRLSQCLMHLVPLKH